MNVCTKNYSIYISFQLSNSLQSLNITLIQRPAMLLPCLVMVTTVEIIRHTPINRRPLCINRLALHRKHTAIRTMPTHKCRIAQTIHRSRTHTVHTIRHRWIRIRRSNNNRICRTMWAIRAAPPVLRTVDPCKIFQSVATVPSTAPGKYWFETHPALFQPFSRHPKIAYYIWICKMQRVVWFTLRFSSAFCNSVFLFLKFIKLILHRVLLAPFPLLSITTV